MYGAYKFYPKGSKLWEEGMAYGHWIIMYQLGYGQKKGAYCGCQMCKMAEKIFIEATEEDKNRKTISTKPKLNWFGRRQYERYE
jgi:hypothetical protein